MNLTSIKYSLAITLLLALSLSAQAEVTIVSNANIYTVSDDLGKVEAFAFEGDTFVGTGSIKQLQKKFTKSKTLDLAGATVIPGIIDAHGHVLSLGDSLLRVNLVDTKDKADILQRLKNFAKNLPEDQWLLGRGWDQNDWPVKELPTAKDLDVAFPKRPVWLNRIDGHANWGNSAAMALAKKDLNGDWQPDGGIIVRDQKGNPSGVFIDNAANLIWDVIPTPTSAQLQLALDRAIEKTASVGLTSVHDAGTSLEVWRILESMKNANKLNLRFYAMADGNSDMLNHLCKTGAIIDPDALLTARAVKLYSDGALGSRGAALLKPYSDDNHSGLLLETPKVLAKYAKRAADCGLQVNIHAIGDKGNRVTLDALQGAANKDNPGRHRIEHSQIIEASDFKRFKELAVIASVQPTHATSDMYWAEDRVGAKRIKGAYAWQTFIDNDIPLALGSDFPVEKAAPLLGFHAAVTRQDAKNWPAKGWYPEQRLSRQEALYGFTLGAAYAAFQEDQLGSIEAGKKADFVILSQDIMTVPEDEILQTEIRATYLGGKAIYQAAKE